MGSWDAGAVRLAAFRATKQKIMRNGYRRESGWVAPFLFLPVEGNVKFGGELTGVEWAAGEVAVADLDGGNFAPTVVHADDQILGIGIVFDVHFAEFNAAISQERFCAAAIGAPHSAIEDDGFHSKELTP